MTLKNLPGSEPDVTYAYDNLGRLTSAAKPAFGISLSFTYDALSRKLTEVGPHGTASSQWDLAGRRTRLTWPDSFFVDYDYLVTGETTAIRENGAASGAGVLATFAYDDLGRAVSLTRGNGALTSYAYDPVSRLQTLTDKPSSATWDQTITLTYNPASQIVTRTGSNDSYAWTGHGNGTTASVSNGLNQQTSIGGTSASWDSKGNLTADPASGKSYTYYPSDNALWTSSSPFAAMSYDPLGRLAIVDSASDTSFAYDGLATIAEYDGAGTMLARYVHGPGLDQPLERYDGAGTSNKVSLHADERGSIVALSYGSPYAPTINRYDEYGKSQSSNVGRFQYTGQMWLSEAGLYHYKARAYLPHLGIFGQTDPIGYAGSPNLYAYVLNDPVNLTDALGLQSACPTSSDQQIFVCGVSLGGGASLGGAAGGAGGPGSGAQIAGDSSLPPAVTPEQAIVITGERLKPQKPIVITGTRVVQLAPWLEPFLPHLLFPELLLYDPCAVACFEAGTLVATPTGLTPIEKIAVGDLVLSQDEQTGVVAAKRVTRLIRPNPKPVYELALRDASGDVETFHVTGDHRWKVDGKGWIATAELMIGDRVETGSKAIVTVASLSLTKIVERTYNLEVADWHTFMVGRDHVVVHNGCIVPTDAQELARSLRSGKHVSGRNPHRFNNRGMPLPPGGDYRAYDVNPSRGNRGGERLIYDPATGRAWYTPDHYTTFVPL